MFSSTDPERYVTWELVGYTRISLGRGKKIDFESGQGTDEVKSRRDQMEKEMKENNTRDDWNRLHIRGKVGT